MDDLAEPYREKIEAALHDCLPWLREWLRPVLRSLVSDVLRQQESERASLREENGILRAEMLRGLSILQDEIARHAKLCRNDVAHDHRQYRRLGEAVAIFDAALSPASPHKKEESHGCERS